jgi:hypothetical protein
MAMTRDAPTASFGDGVALYPSYLGAFVTGRVSPRSAGKRSSFGACPVVAPRLGRCVRCRTCLQLHP